jgi:hypothetical protein
MGNTQPGGLSAEDRDRLEALYLQRDAAMAQQDYLNAQTLAGQIAEIAEASGDGYMQVLEEMGVSAEELAERLHLDNVQQLDEWIARFQEQTDSNGEHSTILADLLRQILAAIRGDTVVTDSGRERGYVEPGGRSRNRMLSDEDAEAVGREVGRAISGSAPRNGRQATAGAGSRGR